VASRSRAPGRAGGKNRPVSPAVASRGLSGTLAYLALAYLALAFFVRAAAAALDALRALARRSSGVIFAARAFPPMLPAKRIAWLMSAVLRLFVMYFTARLVFSVADMSHIMYRSATVKQA
jgi:hypothetical protein